VSRTASSHAAKGKRKRKDEARGSPRCVVGLNGKPLGLLRDTRGMIPACPVGCGFWRDCWSLFRDHARIPKDPRPLVRHGCSLENGALSGLVVAITAGCSVVEPWASVLIGGLAGVFYVLSFDLLIKLRIDDFVSAIPVHLANGIWGLIAVGLFAEEAAASRCHTSVRRRRRN
jgi:hypothetical protein